MKFFELPHGIIERHRKWSDEQFGPRSERGPQGPLKHLIKEAGEALDDPHDIMEYADMMFLFLDSLHRAGFDCADLSEAMAAKMPILESRTYPKVASDMPSEHIRTPEEELARMKNHTGR